MVQLVRVRPPQGLRGLPAADHKGPVPRAYLRVRGGVGVHIRSDVAARKGRPIEPEADHLVVVQQVLEKVDVPVAPRLLWRPDLGDEALLPLLVVTGGDLVQGPAAADEDPDDRQ